MPFKKTREEILGEMMEDASKKLPQITYYAAGGVFRLFLEMAASLIKKAYDLLDALAPNRYLQTAQGQYLDWKAEELGLFRRPAVRARGYVVFHREKASSNLLIPAGKLIASYPDSKGKVFRYAVLEETVMEEGLREKALAVEAEAVGAEYNSPHLGTAVTPISGIDSISRQNNWLSLPGSDEESDASLRLRCQTLWKGVGGANGDAYAAWARGVPGVGSVKIAAAARGAGTVDVICTAEGNAQPNGQLIDLVQEAVDLRKPIATDCLVRAPHEVYIDIEMRAVFLPGWTPQKQPIEEAVARFFQGMEIGTDYEPSALTAALHSLAGVKSLYLAGERGSHRISDLQIARLGALSLDVSVATEA